jgi:peroxiredoxin
MARPSLLPGDPAPFFIVRSSNSPEFHFGTVGGRHVVLCFLESAGRPECALVFEGMRRHRAVFDDRRASLFIVSNDPGDEADGRLRQSVPGIRIFWDFERKVAELYGVTRGREGATFPCAVLLDPTLRVMRWFFGTEEKPDFSMDVADCIGGLPYPLAGPAAMQAPVLILPRVFEPDFCRVLIDRYDRGQTYDSGYMKYQGETIRAVIDYSMKRRTDCLIEDRGLRQAIGARIRRRLLPEIRRVFRFEATRMERYLVACYDATVGGYFRPHRDNDGAGHRQFAVTLNLNAEEYEGGDLRFPEYGLQTYRAPTGGAVVFSCCLLHEATPVTSGRRYAFLPFLYDEAAARIREANNSRYVDRALHYSAKTGSNAAAQQEKLEAEA